MNLLNVLPIISNKKIWWQWLLLVLFMIFLIYVFLQIIKNIIIWIKNRRKRKND